MRFSRPDMSSLSFCALAAAYLLFIPNMSFWRKGLDYFSGHEVALASLAAGLFLLFLAFLTTFSLKYLIKPLVICLILIAAVASYYVDTFGVLVDREMIQNVVLTTPGEAQHLITPAFLRHVAMFGLVPALLAASVRLRHRNFASKFLRNCAIVFPALILAAGITLLNYQAFAGTFRQHRDLISSLNPSAPVISAIRFAKRRLSETNIVVRPLGRDARQADAGVHADHRPVVTILVIGETARAQNFGLDGYSRDTTPHLRAAGVVNFANVTSCGTATAVSLPCMFSVYPRADYSEVKALSTENLTDILTWAGVDVSWFDNDTGAMQVADRIAYEFLPATADPRYCKDGECLDQILVDRLDRALAEVKDNSVIVLHQLGSHGPAYSLRYPPSAEKFGPACHTPQFADCSRQEIVNAYDNTIAYTDEILGRIIDTLAGHAELSTAMVYVSDHGESLGENGIYLHGAPYFMAPDTQTHIPMMAWFSPAYADMSGLDRACLAGQEDAALSHDNFFHTVLGMMDVSTAVYDQSLDAFAACRPAAAVGLAALPGVVR